jgi:hypothetical protein
MRSMVERHPPHRSTPPTGPLHHPLPEWSPSPSKLEEE